jgi:amylo-alpha-1,6-glucosidase
VEALRPEDSLAFERERADAGSGWQRRRRAAASPPSWRSPPTPLSSPRSVVSPTARDCWLSLVYRLGRDTMIALEGFDPGDCASSRGPLDPTHLRLLRARWANPEFVSGGAESGALPQRRRDPVVFPCPFIAMSRIAATRRRCADPASTEGHRSPLFLRHSFRHQGRPGGRVANPGNAPSRGLPRPRATIPNPARSPTRPRLRGNLSTAVSGMPRGGYLYDVVDGEDGDDPSFRPNQILATALEHPVLDRQRWEAVVAAVRDRLVTPVGLRSGPGRGRLQTALFRRSARPRCRLSSRHGVGLADRPVYRRLSHAS